MLNAEMCIEEMSELTKEICKYLRTKDSILNNRNEEALAKIKQNIIKETAGVFCTIEQVQLMFREDAVNKVRDEKIKRCKLRLKIG